MTTDGRMTNKMNDKRNAMCVMIRMAASVWTILTSYGTVCFYVCTFMICLTICHGTRFAQWNPVCFSNKINNLAFL